MPLSHCHLLEPGPWLSIAPVSGCTLTLHANAWPRDSPTCNVDMARSHQRRPEAFLSFTTWLANILDVATEDRYRDPELLSVGEEMLPFWCLN